MKLVFFVTVALCAVTQAQVENEWTKVQSSFGVPFSKYPEILTRIFPYLIDRNIRRIAGGQAATWEQIPYQALLISDGFACGGSIVSQNWILTAAHCLYKHQSAIVYVGFVHQSPMYIAWAIKVQQNDLIIHENYDRSDVNNDIALVRLALKIPDIEYVNSISLPSRAEANENLVGKTANVSGFGIESDQSKKLSPILLWVEVSIVDNSVCDNALKTKLFSSNVCVKSKNKKSSCSGDSGGPLTVLRSNGERVLAGVVKAGFSGGCELGYPVIFTRVHSFLDWIEAKSGIQIS